MSITRIADSVFLDLALKGKKRSTKTEANRPVEGSFFEALAQNQYGTRENSQQEKKHSEDNKEAWKEAQDNSHWFVDENIGTHIDTAG